MTITKGNASLSDLTAEEAIRQALEAAVELAIVRGDLQQEDGKIDMNEAAEDAANACFGIGTCESEPVPEVAELLRRLNAGAQPTIKTLPPSMARLHAFNKHATDGWTFHASALGWQEFSQALDELYGHECRQFDCDGMCDSPQNHAGLSSESEPLPPKPDGWAYRYHSPLGGTEIRLSNGETINGSNPIESIPYYFGEPSKRVPAHKPEPQAREEVPSGPVQSAKSERVSAKEAREPAVGGSLAPEPNPDDFKSLQDYAEAMLARRATALPAQGESAEETVSVWLKNDPAAIAICRKYSVPFKDMYGAFAVIELILAYAASETARADAADARFTEHTQHVQQFLNDMWAFLLDPLHEGMEDLKIAEVCRFLRDAAQSSRDALNDAMNKLSELQKQLLNQQCCSIQSLIEAGNQNVLSLQDRAEKAEALLADAQRNRL